MIYNKLLKITQKIKYLNIKKIRLLENKNEYILKYEI